MRQRLWVLLASCGFVLIAVLAADFSGAEPTCYTYSNSRPSWIQGHGAVCAYTGGSCRECYQGGVTCVDNPDSGGGACLRYDYPAP